MCPYTSAILLVPRYAQLVPDIHTQLATVCGGVAGEGSHPVLLLAPIVVDVVQTVEQTRCIGVEWLH